MTTDPRIENLRLQAEHAQGTTELLSNITSLLGQMADQLQDLTDRVEALEGEE